MDMDFELERNSFGRLVLIDAAGQRHEGVVPVRAFPIAAPDEGLSLISADGRELAWIARLAELPAAARTLLDEELAQREFVPVVRRIQSVSTFSTPSIWQVETDRGETQFVLKAEEDIRRLEGPDLLITDSHGIQFLVRDRWALDKASRRLLERFL
ncbi:DUF1854 domain-containing protein [Roseateles toxinivorans]|nr:DUF1854 domain-containing protein [Roseateles toxinivorans]